MGNNNVKRFFETAIFILNKIFIVLSLLVNAAEVGGSATEIKLV